MIFGVRSEHKHAITDRLLYELFRSTSGDGAKLWADIWWSES